MKRILFATDFSENAANAFVYALKIAQKHKAELIMLHVFDIPTSWNNPYTEDALEMERQLIRESEDKLKELFEQHSEPRNVRYIATENTSVVKGILSTIKENNPGLIVVGTKGESKVNEVIVGSTTKKLIKQSPVPVLAVPENAALRDFKNVLYATDFRDEDIPAIQRLVEFVRPFDPEITVIHLRTNIENISYERMERLSGMVNDRIENNRIKFQLVLSDNIFEKLNTYINQYGYDLLVMLEKERDGIIDRLFHHDLVQKMNFHTSVPLLSFRENALRALDKDGVGIGAKK